MEIEHYPFRFVKKDVEAWQGMETFMTHRLLYSFKSTKTNQTYWVWVEVYKHHFYAVKFHLKNHRNSEHKYNIMTGLNEARQCIKTVMSIMFEVAKSDSRASFGFIGANTIFENVSNTKRFRVYRCFMQSYFGESSYTHFMNIEKSAYMLLNKKELSDNPKLLDEIVNGFHELYPYFE